MPPKTEVTLESAKKYLNKTIGEGSIMSLSGDIEPIPVISTGSFLIDAATGVGGLPCGKIIELYGHESSGKSTVLSSTAAQCQKGGRAVLFLDFENGLDQKYLLAQGVDLSSEMFLYSQPDSLEAGLKIASYCIENDLIGLVVADSVAAMLTVAEISGEIGDTHAGGIAVQARVMSAAMKKLVPLCSAHGVVFAFINQVRSQLSLSPFERSKGITRETTPGGTALKFYSSLRIKFSKVSTVKGKIFNPIQGGWEDGVVATKVRVEIIKNKCAPPGRKAEFLIRYGIGIDDVMSMIMVAIDRKLLKKSGSFIKVPAAYHNSGEDTNIQGLENTCTYFRKEFPVGFENLEADLKALIQHDLDFAEGQSYESEIEDEDDLLESSDE